MIDYLNELLESKHPAMQCFGCTVAMLLFYPLSLLIDPPPTPQAHLFAVALTAYTASITAAPLAWKLLDRWYMDDTGEPWA